MNGSDRPRAGSRPAERALAALMSAFAAVGGIALAVLVGFTVVAVFWRYALNDPIFGVEDVSTMTLTIVVSAAIACGAQRGSHLSVDVIGTFAGRRVTRVTDAVARLLSLAAVTVAAGALFVKGSCGLPCGAVTGSMSIVHTPFYYALGAALTAYALLLASRLLADLADFAHGSHGSSDGPDEPGD